MLRNGLYEQVINKGLDTELANADKLCQTAPIDTAEASKVLAKYVAEVVEKGLENVKDNGGDLASQVELVNRIVSTIIAQTREREFDATSVAERAEQLLALFDRQNSIWAVDEKAQVVRPETSITQSSLFTGAIHEPQMYTELKKEIVSCNRIDMLVSFIKWSGLRLAEDKECLTVLDFIGQVNRKYNFDDKFAALLSNTTRSVTREIKDGFVSALKGCYIQLEKKATKYILDNIRASYGNSAGLVAGSPALRRTPDYSLLWQAFWIIITLIPGQSISLTPSLDSVPAPM